MSRRIARIAQDTATYNRNFPALPPTQKEKAVRTTTKRKEAPDGEVQFEPRKVSKPENGLFIPKPPKKPTMAAIVAASAQGMDAIQSPEAKAQEEAARKLLLEQFMGTLDDDDKAATTGSIRFITSGPPRYTSWRAWKKSLASDPPAAIEYQLRENSKKHWAWAQVYATPSPTAKDGERLERAIAHVSTLEQGKGLDPRKLQVRLIKKQGGKHAPSILIFAEDEEQCNLLTALFAFEFREDEGSSIFFIHGAKKNSTAIILDIKNGPEDAKALMKGCLRAFYDAIKWTKTSEKTLTPAHFAYAKVAGLRSQAGEAGSTWRVAFVPNPTAGENWKYQPTAGAHGDKGEVTIDRPPFCERCISHSHQPQFCNWWTHDNTRTEAKRPADYVPLKWTSHKEFQRSDLPEGAALRTNQPDADQQPTEAVSRET